MLDDDLLEEQKEKIDPVLSEDDIIRLAVRQIIKEKSKLKSKEEAKAFLLSKWRISDEIMEAIFTKLTKSKNRSLMIGGIIVGIFIIGLMMYATSNGRSGFTPGIIFLILGGMSLNTGLRLQRILEN